MKKAISNFNKSSLWQKRWKEREPLRLEHIEKERVSKNEKKSKSESHSPKRFSALGLATRTSRESSSPASPLMQQPLRTKWPLWAQMLWQTRA